MDLRLRTCLRHRCVCACTCKSEVQRKLQRTTASCGRQQADVRDQTGRTVLSLCLTCTGDEAEGIIARLHILPEVDVAVIEDVLVQVEVVEALQAAHRWLSPTSLTSLPSILAEPMRVVFTPQCCWQAICARAHDWSADLQPLTCFCCVRAGYSCSRTV